MALDVPALRTSFHLLFARAPNLIPRFYDVLFARHPRARPLFGSAARHQQEQMLARALIAVMNHLDDEPWLRDQLGALGAKHDAHGVLPEMYEWVGDALLTTLADVAGDTWTPALERSWSEAYEVIAGMMRQGASHPKIPVHRR